MTVFLENLSNNLSLSILVGIIISFSGYLYILGMKIIANSFNAKIRPYKIREYGILVLILFLFGLYFVLLREASENRDLPSVGTVLLLLAVAIMLTSTQTKFKRKYYEVIYSNSQYIPKYKSLTSSILTIIFGVLFQFLYFII